MKRFLEMFVLTPYEQRFVVLAVLTLVIGASVKNYRERKIENPRWPAHADLAPAGTAPPSPHH